MNIPISKEDALLIADQVGIFLYPSFNLTRFNMAYRRLPSGASLEIHKDPLDKRRRVFFLVSNNIHGIDVKKHLHLIGQQDLYKF